VPWLRFGFANIVVLLVLLRYGFISALWVNIIRVFVASMIVGTFLGPGFILSLGGAIVSLSAMGLAFWATDRLSPFGLSVIGAFFHSLAQLALAQTLFVKNLKAILLISPIVLLVGLAAGTINGLVVLQIVKKIEPNDD
jgi:heptaprenyl diphosphate synthase